MCGGAGNDSIFDAGKGADTIFGEDGDDYLAGGRTLQPITGFITGLILGSVFALAPRLTQLPRVNLVTGILFATLVILPWLRALARTNS